MQGLAVIYENLPDNLLRPHPGRNVVALVPVLYNHRSFAGGNHGDRPQNRLFSGRSGARRSGTIAGS
jgi:hypothetical protein